VGLDGGLMVTVGGRGRSPEVAGGHGRQQVAGEVAENRPTNQQYNNSQWILLTRVWGDPDMTSLTF